MSTPAPNCFSVSSPHLSVPRALAAAITIVLSTACVVPELSREETERLRREVGVLGELPPSPSNAVADSPLAARWGQILFFDQRMSLDGAVACASCHVPGQGWSDDRRLSVGAHGRLGLRHSQPLWNVGYNDFYFWDGRADSAWSQALDAIEEKWR